MDEPKETPLHEKDFHNILLWMPNWIGDVILVMPALSALRKKFPHSRITAVVKAPADKLLSAHPAVDTVMQLPSGPSKGFLAGLRFAGRLRKYQFDLGIVFPNSIRSALLLSISGAKNRLGYDTEGREIFLTHAVRVTSLAKRTEYRVDYFFNLLSSLKLDPEERRFLPLKKNQEDQVVEEFLANTGWKEDQFLIALHPGTSKLPRGWHVERFGILCQKLAKEYPVKIVVLGQEKEAALLAQIRRFSPDHVVPLPPNMDLPEVATLLERCDLFIGNDSGMMHLASMVNTPVVGIYGPGSPLTSGPFMDPEKIEIVSKNFDCSPCRQKFFKECKPSPHNKPYCLEDISVKDVAEAVDRLLKKIESKKAASVTLDPN
ncbi:MAG: lipopolysaccharide heptosyltransferase II [Nitrospinae bacterium]|nr:lipopolysaccharide heptosyltransferase II [Nitrospinota bacterium]